MQYHVNIIFFYQACKFNYETALSFQEKQQSHVYGKLNYKASILDVYFFFSFAEALKIDVHNKTVSGSVFTFTMATFNHI